MAFCQWGCNWVCQPPLQLLGVGIYSHGCKQGCFQPPRPGGSDPSRRSGFGGHAPGPMVQQHNGGKVHPRLGCGRTLSGWNEVYEPAILWGGGSAGCPGLRPPKWKGGPAALGLAPAWLGTRWAADVAECTEDTGPRLLCVPRRIYLAGRTGEPGLTGRMGVRPVLNIPYPTGPTSCLARTRSTGSR